MHKKTQAKHQNGSVVIILLGLLSVVIIIGAGFVIKSKNSRASIASDHPASTTATRPASRTNSLEAERPQPPITSGTNNRVPLTAETKVPLVEGIASGKFSQPNNTDWSTGQPFAYIGVMIDPGAASQVKRVEWYQVTGGEEALKYTQSSTSTPALYQYDWPISGVSNGKYHWLAKIYDMQDNYKLAVNNEGGSYVDMTVSNQH